MRGNLNKWLMKRKLVAGTGGRPIKADLLKPTPNTSYAPPLYYEVAVLGGIGVDIEAEAGRIIV